MTLRFHPRVVTVIKAAVASSCLKKFDGVITKDVGHALAGSNGTPLLEISYSPPNLTFEVENAPVSQPGILFLGLTRIDFPWLGGVLVPDPRWPLLLVSDAAGKFSVTAPVRGSFPGGATSFTQTWFLDPTGANQLAATNAVQTELIKP